MNAFEPNHFENKVVFLNITADKIRNLIENELITIDIYKNTITAQKNYENSILAALSQKKDAFDKEVYDIIVERINKRIALIDSELAEEIPENLNELYLMYHTPA